MGGLGVEKTRPPDLDVTDVMAVKSNLKAVKKNKCKCSVNKPVFLFLNFSSLCSTSWSRAIPSGVLSDGERPPSAKKRDIQAASCLPFHNHHYYLPQGTAPPQQFWSQLN